MRLKPFRLHQPTTVEEASALLVELGDDAAPYCGGTELFLVAKLGFANFTDLVDVKRIGELSGITVNRGLRIGAAVTHRQIEHSELVAGGWPALSGVERSVGNLRVRNMGTIGGNLSFADPHSDPATYLAAAGGSVTVRGTGPQRRIPIEEFVVGPYITALAHGELLVSVHIPMTGVDTVTVHRKMSFHERPAITVAVQLTITDGAIADPRIAVGSVGPRIGRASAAERTLDGAALDSALDAHIRGAAEIAGDESDPVADSNGSVAYKRQLVRVLTERCIRAALMPKGAASVQG